jgi:hypothetical protein
MKGGYVRSGTGGLLSGRLVDGVCEVARCSR